MAKPKKTEIDHITEARAALLAAALPHVSFDGWSAATFEMALADAGIDAGLAHQAAPRGGYDLAVAFHREGDRQMLADLAKADLSDLRFRDKISLAVKLRLEAVAMEKEAVRRGVTLFALPQNATEGARLIWDTSDAIWKALGDTSRDFNWYSKRATLSGVYSATVLYWLGDESEGHEASWEFLDRRIENVMQFEGLKAKVKQSPLGKIIDGMTERFSAPDPAFKESMPGYQNPKGS